jgi:hypothetical protein
MPEGELNTDGAGSMGASGQTNGGFGRRTRSALARLAHTAAEANLLDTTNPNGLADYHRLTDKALDYSDPGIGYSPGDHGRGTSRDTGPR